MPHSVVSEMVTGFGIPGVIHVLLPGAPQNGIVGLVDAAPTGEETVKTRRPVIRMTLHLLLAKVGVMKTAGPMNERKHHHLKIVI